MVFNVLGFVAAAILAASSVSAHSRLSSPVPRNPNAITGGPWGYTVNCEYTPNPPKASAVYTRGQEIDINWARNNHVGGFIRLAIVPMNSWNVSGIFDKQENIEQLHCHESGCGSADPLNMPGMLGGDPPGKNAPFQNMCTKKFTIPSHLADGDYTLQWLWYGPGSHFGQVYQSEGDYKSCHDFSVKGGQKITKKARNACPVYKGGDIHQRGNKCIYMYETEPEKCTVDTSNKFPNMVWNCGGQINLTYTFGYPYPNLFKTCKKSGKAKRSRYSKRNDEHHGGADLSAIANYEDIPEVQGLDRYYD